LTRRRRTMKKKRRRRRRRRRRVDVGSLSRMRPRRESWRMEAINKPQQHAPLH